MESEDDLRKAKETPDSKPAPKPEPSQSDPAQDDRRAQSRTETILSEIEDATYKVLRKHDDKKPV